jgi:hypothetical protein
VEALSCFFLAFGKWAIFSFVQVKDSDGREHSVESTVPSENPAANLEENISNTTDVTDEIHEIVDISGVRNLIDVHSEKHFSDQPF